MRCWMFVVAAAVAACGPSSAEIRAAKTATYRSDATAQLFAIAEQTAAETYKIASRDPEQSTLMTELQWYNPEGGRESTGAGDFVQLVDRSVQVGFLIEIVETDAGTSVVAITPKTFQHLSGSPKPRELLPDDPNLPPWVHGRAETLQLEIYKRARQLETK